MHDEFLLLGRRRARRLVGRAFRFHLRGNRLGLLFQAQLLKARIFENLHGPGHAADLVLAVRPAHVCFQVTIRQPAHHPLQRLHRRHDPGSNREESGQQDHSKAHKNQNKGRRYRAARRR
jgi:hypothetical protein